VNECEEHDCGFETPTHASGTDPATVRRNEISSSERLAEMDDSGLDHKSSACDKKIN
jgi:hypothetical protein